MTTDRYTDIIARLESAGGTDRELDADIDITLFGGETIWKTANYTMETYPASRRPSAQHVGGYANEHVPLYTASIDAAVALTVKKMGSRWWHVVDTAVQAFGRTTLPSSDLPRFLLISLFRALEKPANRPEDTER